MAQAGKSINALVIDQAGFAFGILEEDTLNADHLQRSSSVVWKRLHFSLQRVKAGEIV